MTAASPFLCQGAPEAGELPPYAAPARARNLLSAFVMTAQASSPRVSLALGLFLVASSIAAFAACGGAVNAGNEAGSSGTGGTSGSSGNDDGVLTKPDSGLPTVCPPSAPLPGSACPSRGLACEYGGEGPYLACSTVHTCIEGAWSSNGRGGGEACVALPSENEAACPATFDGLGRGDACPDLHGACVYPEGKCACASCAAPDGGGAARGWSCVPWPVATVCPTPRPRIGSACAVDGQACSYATVCSAVNTGLPNIECDNGLWRDVPVPQPPCAFPTCQ